MATSERRELLKTVIFAAATGISAIGLVTLDRANRNYDSCVSNLKKLGYDQPASQQIIRECGSNTMTDITFGAFVWITGLAAALKDPNTLGFSIGSRRAFLKRLALVGTANIAALAYDNRPK